MEEDAVLVAIRETQKARDNVILSINVNGKKVETAISRDLNDQLNEHGVSMGFNKDSLLLAIYRLKGGLSEEAIHDYLFGPPGTAV